MAINFASGAGNLFNQLGKVGAALNNCNGWLAATAPNPAATWGASGPNVAAFQTNIDDLVTQLNANANTKARLNGLFTTRDSHRQAAQTYRQALRTLAENVLIDIVHADVSLPQKTVAAALAEVIKQMLSQDYRVAAPAVAVGAVTADGPGGANNGDGVCVGSVVGTDGRNLVSVFPETLNVLCTNDSQGGGTRSSEPFSVAGDVAVADQLAHDWPAGSGANTSLTAVDATSTSFNKLTNGGLENFTANVPDNFTLAIGSAGTDFAQETSVTYYTVPTTPKAGRFIGTAGAVLTQLRQDVTLKPNTVYAFNLWMRRSSGTATGVVQFDLHDGTSVINDDAGTANSFSRNIATQVTNSYAAYNVVFRTPRVLPAITRFRIHLTTTLNNTESLYIDNPALTEAAQAYAGGPFVAVFAGNTKFVKNDAFAVPVTNDQTVAKFTTLFERLFSMRSLGLQLRTNGTNLINDNLIA